MYMCIHTLGITVIITRSEADVFVSVQVPQELNPDLHRHYMGTPDLTPQVWPPAPSSYCTDPRRP